MPIANEENRSLSRRRRLMLGLSLGALAACVLASCGPAEGNGAQDAEPVETAREAAPTPDPGSATASAPEPDVARLVQGGENPDLLSERGPIVAGEAEAEVGTAEAVEAAADASQEAADSGAASNTESALSGLPGFVPAVTDGEAIADDEATPARAIPDDAPVIVAVRLIELLTDDDLALAPLRAFLSAEDAGSLNPTEVAAFDEMLGVLRESGVVGQIAAPRVQVTAGESASVEILQASGPGAVGGGGGERVSMSLAPTLRPADENGGRLIELAYDFRSSKPGETAIEVLANELGLEIGPRARVAGTGVVASRETFYMVRRFRGGAIDRELLILVRADVLPGALNK